MKKPTRSFFIGGPADGKQEHIHRDFKEVRRTINQNPLTPESEEILYYEHILQFEHTVFRIFAPTGVSMDDVLERLLEKYMSDD